MRLCECRHDSGVHARSKDRCKGADSYGMPCTCPSFVEMSDDDGGDELDRVNDLIDMHRDDVRYLGARP